MGKTKKNPQNQKPTNAPPQNQKLEKATNLTEKDYYVCKIFRAEICSYSAKIMTMFLRICLCKFPKQNTIWHVILDL